MHRRRPPSRQGFKTSNIVPGTFTITATTTNAAIRCTYEPESRYLGDVPRPLKNLLPKLSHGHDYPAWGRARATVRLHAYDPAASLADAREDDGSHDWRYAKRCIRLYQAS